jgi:hypothetical protein
MSSRACSRDGGVGGAKSSPPQLVTAITTAKRQKARIRMPIH